jgi:hypothetical protein
MACPSRTGDFRNAAGPTLSWAKAMAGRISERAIKTKIFSFLLLLLSS